MRSIVATCAVAVLAFLSTDIDDLFLLMTLYADRGFRRRDIVVGQFGGLTLLYAASVAFALTSTAVPRPWLGLAGFIPISIGAYKLWKVLRGEGGQDPVQDSREGNLAAALLLTLSYGSDNLATWIPLFATRTLRDILFCGLVFAAMAAVWCFAASWLVRHPPLGAPLRRYGHKIVPIALLVLGWVILIQAGSLALLGGPLP